MSGGRRKYTCKVIGCDSSYYWNVQDENFKNIKFHSFPTREEVREAWKKVCGIDESVLLPHRCPYYVCEKHFATSDYNNPERIRLNWNAVPKLQVQENFEDKNTNDFEEFEDMVITGADENIECLNYDQDNMSVNLYSVLISDPIHEDCANLLTSHGISVTTKYKLSKQELIKELEKHDGLIVRSETKVTADIIDATSRLSVIGRAGTGVDNIDILASTRKGILVLNTPGGNSISACELTCSLIAALARNVVQASQSMKEGRWDRKLYTGSELSDKILGIIGFGRIGREVARRMQSYGMRIIAYDPFLTLEQAAELDVIKGELKAIWECADYITVHTPLIPQTKNLINATTLSKCKQGVYVINVARGGIIDEEALLNSIQSGHCAGAALDVFTDEPPKNPITLELIRHPNVITTPHLGASTAEAQTRVASEIAEQFIALSGKSTKYALTGIINAPVMVAAANADNKPWIELARRLGNIIGKFIDLRSQVIVDSHTTGFELLNDKFVSTAILVGLLANHGYTKLNLVNASDVAKECDIQINESHESSDLNAITVKAGSHTIKGTILGGAALLLSIDDAVFTGGVHLQENLTIFKVERLQDLSKIVYSYVNKNISIHNLSMSGNWIIVQTNEPITVHVDGVTVY